MKVKVEGQCFYHDRSVHMPGKVLDVDESYLGHPALVPYEEETENVGEIPVTADSSTTVSTSPEPVGEEPTQVPAEVVETTAVATQSDGFDDFDTVPKTKTTKKG